MRLTRRLAPGGARKSRLIQGDPVRAAATHANHLWIAVATLTLLLGASSAALSPAAGMLHGTTARTTDTVPSHMPMSGLDSYQGTQVVDYQGFDSCVPPQPSTSQMQAMWTGTPFDSFFMYLGGSWAVCSSPGGSWVTTVLNEGWNLVTVWVGPQCCGSGSAYISSTSTSTAYQQGVTQAQNAFNAICASHLCYSSVAIAYDFEFDDAPTYEHAFLGGWDWELGQLGMVYGAYASSGNPSYEVQNWASTVSPVPEFVWPADWTNPNNDSAFNVYELSNNDWVYTQRHHQYRGGHYSNPNVTNGQQVWMDSDCSDGPAFGQHSAIVSNGQYCIGGPQ
jgi:hypothetical protein